jgi:heme-degrading monooxygenase HmoA
MSRARAAAWRDGELAENAAAGTPRRNGRFVQDRREDDELRIAQGFRTHSTGEGVEIVLIDTFIVPEESRAKFLDEVRRSAVFLRTLPGFVEGFVYEKTDGAGRNGVVTTAVWKDEEAFQEARASAAKEFKKIGFDPAKIMKNLKIEMERAVYCRSPY